MRRVASLSSQVRGIFALCWISYTGIQHTARGVKKLVPSNRGQPASHRRWVAFRKEEKNGRDRGNMVTHNTFRDMASRQRTPDC